jgi:hypothetical protein
MIVQPADLVPLAVLLAPDEGYIFNGKAFRVAEPLAFHD